MSAYTMVDDVWVKDPDGCQHDLENATPVAMADLLNAAYAAGQSSHARLVAAARSVTARLDPDMHPVDIRQCRDVLLTALAEVEGA